MSHSRYHITCEFEYKDKYYIAWLTPYYELSDYEMEVYRISEFNYVVHLFSMQGFKTFEMFPDDRAHWTTNASSTLIDKEIVEIVGYVLVNAFK
jgi:hypothetical protein